MISISNKNKSYNLSCRNEKNQIKNKNKIIMNQILLKNPNLLKNLKKRKTKTPNKIRTKKPLNSIINSNKSSSELKGYSLREVNNNQKNLQKIKEKKFHSHHMRKNLSEILITPLLKYKFFKNENGIEINRLFKNKPYRAQSFSILKNGNNECANESNENNNNIKLNNNYLNKNEENNKENNNINSSIKDSLKKLNNQMNTKKKNKVCKKIYKIESLCQVGYSGPGMVKYNQDNFFVYKNLNDENNVLFIGVCDGHGLLGHDVSKYLINHLPENLNKALKKTNKYINHKETLYKTMKDVFIKTNKDLCNSPFIDTKFSGSTCVTIILTKNKIISGNAGDSRAVMGRCKNGEWISIELTQDQKPNNPGERERILSHGGRIEAYKDENGNDFGPKRVWIQNEDIPGLAMSRSFGDEVAASVGTISEPEIKSFELTLDDKFIIIASDGIWEFISSQECVNIIKDFYLKKDLKGCLKYLLNESSKRWIKEEEVIDDITAVLIFFED